MTNHRRYVLVEIESHGGAALTDMDEPERIQRAIRSKIEQHPGNRTFRTADVTDLVTRPLVDEYDETVRLAMERLS